MSFPNKEKREKCWSSRDAYWECLDQNDENDSKCQEQKKCFESNCPNTWVQHFKRRREYLKFKDKLETEDPVEKLKEYSSNKQ